MDRVRVALSNDYEIVLRGLSAVLEPHADEVEVVEAGTGEEFPDDVDVILFDTFGRLPAEDDKLREVVAANPEAKVVVYSWHTYPPEAAREHGAVTWIAKGVPGEELAALLRAVHEGTAPLAVEAGAAGSADEGMPDWPGRAEGLSPREGEVLALICRGLTNEEIAARAYLSVNTVKTYIRTAYRKIGARSRAQAILWGIDHGLRGTRTEA